MSGATKILMGSGGVDLPSDDQFNRVNFLSHFDGADNGTNIVYDDSSASNHTVSVGGTPSQGTFSPFSRVEGEWSNYFPADYNYLEIASTSDFNFGTGDFTWEWFYFGAPSGSYPVFYSQTGADFGVYYNVSDGKVYYDNDVISDTAMGTLPLNSWNHIAVSRVSGTSNLYLNGTRTATVSDGKDWATGTARVGNYRLGDGSTYPMKGYISNLRIIKGTGLYSASSITVPTSALTAISGTVLLTCQSNRFKDNSASAHALTVGGTPKVTAFTPILTSKVYASGTNGASAWYIGNGVATSVDVTATGSDFAYGTGAFTIEGWFYREDSGATYPFVYSQGDMMQFYFSGSNFNWQITETQGGTNVLNSSTTLGSVTHQWNHWAVSRSGSNLSVFINGVRALTTASASNTFTAASGGGYKDLMRLGNHSTNTSSYPFGGYQSDFRILKGTALYDPTSSTCTVPTAPLTAITNTKLLLNMADGQVLDSAAQHNMSLAGNADSSTSDKKFGTASLALDGTGDGAFVRGVQDFVGPFTIECWAKAPNTASKFLWNIGQYKLELGIYGANLRGYTAAHSYTNYFTGGEFTVNTWHHVALVRDTSNVLKCYLNGTASSTTVTDSTTYVATNNIFIIGGEWASTSTITGGWEGYIDEFRISRYARYTSNFTPSTEAFPDKGQ